MAIQNAGDPFNNITVKTLGLYLLAGFLVGVLFAVILLSGLQIDGPSMVQNLISESLGIGFTVFVIDQLNQRRQAKHDLRQLQEQLVRDAGSTSNETAKNAVFQMQKRDWLKGDKGLLKGEHLEEAKLRGASLTTANLSGTTLWSADLAHTRLSAADLSNAVLQEADLRHAELQTTNLNYANLYRADLSDTDGELPYMIGAFLKEANLSNAFLRYAKLNNANLENANLSNTRLEGADLTNANFSSAKLLGTDLRGADMTFANLYNAQFNAETILPDGTHWTPDTDWTKFGAIVEPPE